MRGCSFLKNSFKILKVHLYCSGADLRRQESNLPSFAFKNNKQLLYPVEQRNRSVPSLQALDLILKDLKTH